MRSHGKTGAVFLLVATGIANGGLRADDGFFVRGDVNSDLVVNVSDPSFIFQFLFLGGETPACFDSADANDDGGLDIGDGIYSLSFLFRGGPPFPPPGLDCGLDPTEDALDCVDSPCRSEPSISLRSLDGEAISAMDTREVRLEAMLEGFEAVVVQFEFSRGGASAFEIDTVVPDGGLVRARWNVETLAPGEYEVCAVGVVGDDQLVADCIHVSVEGSLPAPYFVSPDSGSEVAGDLLSLEVSQDVSTTSWASVRFGAGVDGVNFELIGEDVDGSDGFSVDWDLSNVPPGAFVVRAEVEDLSGNVAVTKVQISRIYESDFFDRVPESAGVIEFVEFSSEGKSVPLDRGGVTEVDVLRGEIVASIDPAVLAPGPESSIHATLYLDSLEDDEQLFSSSVEISANDEEGARFFVAGLREGLYRAVIVANYTGGGRHVDVRSPVVQLSVNRSDFPDASDPELAASLLRRLTEDGLTSPGVAEVHLKQGEDVAAAVFGSREYAETGITVRPSAELTGERIDMVVVVVSNQTAKPLSDTLAVRSFAWNENGDVIPKGDAEFEVSVDPFGQTQVEVVPSPGDTWGDLRNYAGLEASLVGAGAGYQAFGAAIGAKDVGLFANIPLEFGLGMVSFRPSPFLNINFNTGFPEYHWVRCDKVRNVIPNPDPFATYKWTVTNTNGTTWTSRGKTIRKHAAILGGPHQVRVTCTKPDGTTKVYGSDHFVHPGINDIEVTDVLETTEYECGETLVGLSGPGGTLCYTDGVSVTRSVTIESSISGTIGKEGVASIGSSIGASAGQSVTQTKTTGYKKEIPEGECRSLKARLCFQVWRGKVKVDFTDGTTIESKFEAKRLEGVGYKPVAADCP